MERSALLLPLACLLSGCSFFNVNWSNFKDGSSNGGDNTTPQASDTIIPKASAAPGAAVTSPTATDMLIKGSGVPSTTPGDDAAATGLTFARIFYKGAAYIDLQSCVTKAMTETTLPVNLFDGADHIYDDSNTGYSYKVKLTKTGDTVTAYEIHTCNSGSPEASTTYTYAAGSGTITHAGPNISFTLSGSLTSGNWASKSVTNLVGDFMGSPATMSITQSSTFMIMDSDVGGSGAYLKFDVVGNNISDALIGAGAYRFRIPMVGDLVNAWNSAGTGSSAPSDKYYNDVSNATSNAPTGITLQTPTWNCGGASELDITTVTDLATKIQTCETKYKFQ